MDQKAACRTKEETIQNADFLCPKLREKILPTAAIEQIKSKHPQSLEVRKNHFSNEESPQIKVCQKINIKRLR